MFSVDGFEVFQQALSANCLAELREATVRVCGRFRRGDEAAAATGVSLGEYTERRPERNPGVSAADLGSEPYILGNLAGMDVAFRRFLSRPHLWEIVAMLLGSSPDSLVYHYSQIVRKPAFVGASLSWHRDYANTYISTVGPYFVRLLIPLEDMAEANGGTGVVPRSHMIGDKEAMSREGREEDGAGAIYPRVAAGDVLAIHSKLIHGGGPNRSNQDRQILALQFGLVDAPMLHTAEQIESLTMCRREQMVESLNSTDLGDTRC